MELGDYSDDEIQLETKDPLCDYRADEEDQEWVHSYLMLGYDESIHKSDATLNCPCCFALLCLDSQQHEYYHSQFRAMFVKNCLVDFDRPHIYYPTSDTTSPLAEVSTESLTEDKEVLHKTFCGICNTEVGVFDSEEVFHFYNVSPSEPPSTRKN